MGKIVGKLVLKAWKWLQPHVIDEIHKELERRGAVAPPPPER